MWFLLKGKVYSWGVVNPITEKAQTHVMNLHSACQGCKPYQKPGIESFTSTFLTRMTMAAMLASIASTISEPPIIDDSCHMSKGITISTPAVLQPCSINQYHLPCCLVPKNIKTYIKVVKKEAIKAWQSTLIFRYLNRALSDPCLRIR